MYVEELALMSLFSSTSKSAFEIVVQMVTQIKNSTETFTATGKCSFSVKLHTGNLQLKMNSVVGIFRRFLLKLKAILFML